MHKGTQQKLRNQEAFLQALLEYGHDGAAAMAAGISVAAVSNWKREDEFNERYNDAFVKFSGSLVREAITRGRDGYQEPIVYKGEVQYIRDSETGELMLDDALMPIPATITKKSDGLLKMALRANIKEYQPNSSIELTGPDGTPITNNITVEFIKPIKSESEVTGEQENG